MRVHLEVEAVLAGPDVEEHLRAVADRLCDLEGAIDPDVGAELATGKVWVTIAVDAASELEATERAIGMLRAAIDAASTGALPEAVSWSLKDVRPVDWDSLVA